MWHTKEITKIFVQISNDYGFDVYNDRKKCVGLCGDLLSKYATEKNVFQMLFQAGLGETFSGAPYKTEQELRRGISRIEAFLVKQAIERSVRNEVIDILFEVISGRSNIGSENPYKPEVVKSYTNLHFIIKDIELASLAEKVQISFMYLWKKNDEKIDTLLEDCIITDKFNVSHHSHMDYCCFPYGKGGKTSISINQGTSKLLITGAVISLSFLCSNRKRIVTSYVSDLSHKLTLKQIEIFQMTDMEYEKMQDIMNLLKKTSEKEKERNITQIQENDAIADAAPAYTSSDIQEYSDALRKEILYLKQGKGKRYKIVNGVKINKDKGLFTYSFELESDLHLPDDAPVVVEAAGGIRAVGSVLVCEDFNILLLLDRDMNDRVGSAFLMVEPWKLLEGLEKRMTSLNPNVNKLAIKLMEDGPELATTDDISLVPKGQNAAFEKIKNEDIVAVWGPPGTGKTYTMAKIAMEYISVGKSVLIVSHSNVSVDGVIKQVLKQLDSNMQSWLQEGKIIRFGYVRDDELSKHPYATSFNYALSNNQGLAKELDALTLRRDELRAKNQTNSVAYDEVEKKIKGVRAEIRKEERKYVEKALLLGTTISKATVDPIFEERQYDLVMFDEVSMAYVPQVIVAAALAREMFLCVGDFRQLAPIAQGPHSKDVLQVDIFSYLQIVDNNGNMYWHPWLVMLNEQRRMHEDIAAFPNKYVYKRLLQNHDSIQHAHDDILGLEPLAGSAVNLIDLAGTYCAADKDSNNSRFNIMSAMISFASAVKAKEEGVGSIAIITPYAAQTRLIRAMIRDFYGYGNVGISCATVHQFQGSEADVVIFDAVESYPGNKVGFLMGKVPSEVVRLINVAITRAKGKLITVANDKFWDNVFHGTNHVLYKFLCHTKEKHNVISIKDKSIKPYIESVNPGKMMTVYTDEGQAISLFEKDMARAKGKVVVSIPDGELRETAFKVLDIIDMADDKGVDILMKSNDYPSLPEAWKQYCWGDEKSFFPLIVIDDEVAWFGLPTGKLKLKTGKDTSMITVVQAMVRIRGRNTIEMIKTLTDLENIHIGSSVKTLKPKKGAVGTVTDEVSEDKGAMGVSGLAAHIEKTEFCLQCKSHMKLAKNSRGVAYLTCSNKKCDHTRYLEPAIMNQYIYIKDVQCPKRDGGALQGILGKYGPCVKCSCGHFLKPEEI